MAHERVSFRDPHARHAADHDPARAVASRRRLLDYVAFRGLLVHGLHLAIPGLGTVEGLAEGWRFSRVYT